MGMYIDTHGIPVSVNDPLREMWYSATCCYWTDDWSKLKKFGPGIPCCPQCGSPGMQSMYKHWHEGAIKHDKKEPGYSTFLQDVKEKCFGRGKGIGALWKMKQDGKQKLDGALKEFLDEQGKK